MLTSWKLKEAQPVFYKSGIDTKLHSHLGYFEMYQHPYYEHHQILLSYRVLLDRKICLAFHVIDVNTGDIVPTDISKELYV